MGVQSFKGFARTGLGGTVSALALLVGTMMVAPPAVAQQAASAEAAAARTIAFAIPAQDLNGAMLSFAQAAGLQLFYDSAMVKGLRSTELNGSFTAQQALERLLSGSGMVYRFTGANTVTLEKPRVSGDGPVRLDTVTVEGQSTAPAQSELGNLPPAYAGGQVARGARLGALGNRDVMDTPFNVTAYTAETIENKQARTIADVLQNDPSVRFTTSGGHVMENFSIRGFNVDAEDLALNGMYGMAPDGHAPVEFLERVEVLKGPNAMLSGMAPSGGVGGAINLVPKRAGDTPKTSVAVDYTSDAQVGTHVDVGRRFGTDNRVGVRVNAAYRDGDTVLDGQSKERILGSAAVDYRGEDFRLVFDVYGVKETTDGGSPMMAGFANSVKSLPDAPDSSTNLFQGLKGEQTSTGAQMRAEYDITRDVTAYASVGGKTSEYSGLITSTQAIGTLANGITDLKMINQHGIVHTTAAEAGVRGRFKTGEVGHEMVVSTSALSKEEDKSYRLKWVNGVHNIYNSSSPFFPADPDTPLRYTNSEFFSVGVADTLSALEDRVQLTLGARRQSLNYKNYTDNKGVLSSAYDKTALTPAVGLVVKPFPVDVSLYGNYIEGLTQGGRVTDTQASNFGTVFAPYRTKQKEIGIKWDAGKIANTLSAFRITKPSMSSNSASHTYTQAEQTNTGLEWNVFGELTPGLRALGGITYMKSELKKTAAGQYDGNHAWGTPTWQSNMGLEWDLPWVSGLTVDGRAVYTGEQYVNSANTLKVPDWWRFDVGARYVMDVREQDVTLRATVTNLLDRNYWVGNFSDGYLTLSTPRTFMLSAAVDF